MFPRSILQVYVFLIWISSLWIVIIVIRLDPDSHNTPIQNHPALPSWIQNATIPYPAFNWTIPRFIREIDRITFWTHHLELDLQEPERMGRITVIQNATVHQKYDCGYNSDLSAYSHSTPAGEKPQKHFEFLIPLLVPNSNVHQHFLDGVLPKIVQSWPVISKSNVTILIFRPWDKLIGEILQHIGLDKNRVQFHDEGYITADYLIDTCVTPALHPALWLHAQEWLQTSHVRHPAPSITHTRYVSPALENQFIILLRPGSKITNFNALKLHLFKTNPALFKGLQGDENFKERQYIFSQARLVVGVNSAVGFYNMFLAPKGTHFIDILVPNYPTRGRDGATVRGTDILWKMASMLGQVYWRIYADKDTIPVDTVNDILTHIDSLD